MHDRLHKDASLALATPISIPPSAAAGCRFKIMMDVVLAALLLFFFLPLLLAVAVAVRAESSGPIFFTQRRTGLGGAPFRIIKFRTMTATEDGDSVRQAQRVDGRVTRVGALLRRSSIDELPQLINVLRGEMSLVGPRPHALAHDEQFSAMAHAYPWRFRVRPGITGLAQVRGMRGEIRCAHDIRERVRLDNEYVETWSLALDVQILIKTAIVAPFQRSAY